MEKIGKKLKKTREKKELSKKKVQRDIKIHSRIITAIEEAKIDDLPGPIYVKNFIREYAKYLGLDPKPLLEQFSYTAKNNFKPESFQGFQAKGDYIKRLFYVKRFFYIILIIVIIFGIFWGIKKINFSSKQIKTSRSEPQTAEKKEETRSINQELLVPKSKPLTLKIKTLQDTWVQVKSDGNIVFQKLLPQNETQEFKADNNYKIWVGKASKVKLYLNGVSLEPLGKGVVKNVLIDRSGVNFPDEN